MDAPPSPPTGIIEGFYGPPWSWEDRAELMAWCHERGMTHYVYAPKDDPKHREHWRDPYTTDELDGFGGLIDAGTLAVGFAVSPGLSMDYDAPEDRAALAAKIDQVVDLGVELVVLALDDIPPRPGLGDAHAALATWAVAHLGDRAQVVLVPTDYTSTRPTAYLDALAERCPPEVAIAWTGPTVVCDRLTEADVRARTAALGDRPPLVWDNYPVNDTLMGDRLFLGPLRGRDPDLAALTAGWLANPMVQPRASRLPLASVAGYLRGEDPQRVWEDEADRLGLRTFAEACDGEVPGRLVDALVAAEGRSTWPEHLDALRHWLEAAEAAEAPGLGGEADAWLGQVRAEAGVCLQAVRVLETARAVGRRADRPPDLGAATERILLAAALWQHARRGAVAAFGPRGGVRPVLSQHDDGSWRFHRTSLQTAPNATDRLLAYCADVLDREGRP